MSNTYSLEELAEVVRSWCEANRLVPANGQVAEAITERTIRYYRTIGLLDPPLGGYIKTFSDKHRWQLLAIRTYQAMGLPLRKIRDELYGQSEETLRELVQNRANCPVRPMELSLADSALERWTVFRLSDEFLLVSRQGGVVSSDVLERLTEVLNQPTNNPPPNGRKKRTP